MKEVKYPEITVKLVGEDGNAFAIMARVNKAMRRAKLPSSVFSEYMEEATAGDYDHLLVTTMRWVNTE